MPSEGRHLISLENVSVVYGEGRSRVVAVAPTSFTVDEGETFGLVGESGSGKSSLLGFIAGSVKAGMGRLRITGIEVGRERPKSLRRLVQLVFQDPYGSLHPHHTVDRLLSEPLEIHGFAGISGRVALALEEVGLGNEHRFRFPHQLSGGQRQRIAIARALITEPRLLLLDEPTSALDASIQSEILNLLSDIRARRQLTIMMVSHDLAVIAHMCDRLVVMRKGEIVEVATSEQLRTGTCRHPYTRGLATASQTFRPGPEITSQQDLA
jgi:peptide/nickel transport system ATP-binding protein